MSELEQVYYALPNKLIDALKLVSEKHHELISEIRMRVEKPIVIRLADKQMFISRNGNITEKLASDTLNISSNDMCECLARLCEHSLYSKQRTLNNGYIVMRSGCRAGVCGEFADNDYTLRQASSVNIRIARQIHGADKHIFELMHNKPHSVLIAGPPCCGKTTILRELCRRYSDLMYNVCIIDEKNEIAAINNGTSAFDIGICSDVISLRCKTESASIALKLMNPDIIAFDELADDSNILISCARCGVKVFATLHAENGQDALYRLSCLGVDKSMFDLIVVIDKTTFKPIDVIRINSR